ncbi:MAG TPA: methyltransferase [Planctomycetota bacterium]|nr:methyltransferase [Planctomycetota bacterium]
MAKTLTPDSILQIGFGFWASKTLLTAIEIGLFSELAKGSLDADGVRERFQFHPRSVADFLDCLVAMGMLARKGKKYVNTPQTALFLDRAKPSYVGGILEMCSRRLFKFWQDLPEALRTGMPQNEAKSGVGSPFDAIYKDPESLRGFLSAMTGLSVGSGRTIAKKFPWKKYHSYIDVGCAQGAVPVQLALAHKHLSGAGYDLPVVEPVFAEYVKSFKLESRVRFIGGDFFKDALPSADVIVMGHILHDWNLEEKKMLVDKVCKALPKGGAFIVYDAIIDDRRSRNAFGLLMSLNMLIETPGGFDYTGADCKGWMKAAGFRKTSVVPLMGPDSMVIGIK